LRIAEVPAIFFRFAISRSSSTFIRYSRLSWKAGVFGVSLREVFVRLVVDALLAGAFFAVALVADVPPRRVRVCVRSAMSTPLSDPQGQRSVKLPAEVAPTSGIAGGPPAGVVIPPLVASPVVVGAALPSGRRVRLCTLAEPALSPVVVIAPPVRMGPPSHSSPDRRSRTVLAVADRIFLAPILLLCVVRVHVHHLANLAFRRNCPRRGWLNRRARRRAVAKSRAATRCLVPNLAHALHRCTAY
jgi:hypothetical protein